MVDNNRLVSTCINVLRLLLDKNLHYNEIIRQTSPDRSPDRTHLNYAIEELERGELIMEYRISKHERKRQKIHSQWKIMKITDLGREIADIANSIELYKESHAKLLQRIRKYFDLTEGRKNGALNNILRNRGWKKEETAVYHHSLEGIGWLTESSGMILKEGLFRRYIDVLDEFSPLSGIAKSLMNNLIMDAISYQISILIDSAEENVHVNIGIMTHDALLDFLNGVRYYFPDIVFNEVKDMLVSDLFVLKPSEEETAKSLVHYGKSEDLILPEIPGKIRLTQPKYTNKCLLAAYEEYARTSS